MGCAPSVATSSRYDDLYSIVPKTRAYKRDFDALGIPESGQTSVDPCLFLLLDLMLRNVKIYICMLCALLFLSVYMSNPPLL